MAKYSTQTIQKACRMYRNGCKIREILAETGIRSHTVIYWHSDPEKRARQIECSRLWRDRNPERLREINIRATKKYREKHSAKTL